MSELAIQPPAGSDLAERLPRTTTVLEAGIADGLHLGAQVYVSLDGEVLADGAIGEARAGVPMTPEQLIIWFSMTKATVAVSVAKAWERGLFELDDTIASYVPEFGVRGKERITLRHCLTHTAGFRAGDSAQSSAKEPEENWSELVDLICQVPLEDGWTPGNDAGYHLTCGMTMLAEVLRRVDGRFYPQYVREEVFEPLGMLDCWVGMPLENVDEYDAAGRIGTMHHTAGEAPLPLDRLDSRGSLTRCSPGGGGRGPMRQLARLYEMLLGRGELDGARVLLPQTVEAITARHRVGIFDRTFGIPLDWGLGFGIDSSSHGRHSSRRVFGHGGAQSSIAYCDPEFGLVVALQTNGMPGTTPHYARLAALADAVYEDAGLADPSSPGRDKARPVESGASA
ncbi:MAG TPA: serine hydrolase domain-containing protein [Acidimicrobiales bacterium]|nr:serine hydrolase domain-containing protein [Acidimicrobiales bacterium]